MGGGNGRNAGPREADFGGGSKLINQVRISGPLALCQNFNLMILVMVIQVVYAVGIVPEYTEVGRGRIQPCKTADRLV